MTKWHAHIQSKTTGSVNTLVTNAHRDKILENRDYMLTLIDIILVLAHQGVAFRGHIENETSLNQGDWAILVPYIFFIFKSTYLTNVN